MAKIFLLPSDFFARGSSRAGQTLVTPREWTVEECATSNLAWTTLPQQTQIQAKMSDNSTGRHRTCFDGVLNIYFPEFCQTLFK